MKFLMRLSVLGILVSAFGLGMSACALEGATGDEVTDEIEQVGEAQQKLVTCTTDCSATGGPSITKSCTTCSATSSSITCNGVTTQCQSLPSCITKCSYGVCTSCDEYGYPTTCYVYNGCGGKYQIP
jgi:hypothetical protein